MPNHIQNRLQVSGTPEQIKEVLQFIATPAEGENEAQQIDFNKILPMPESLGMQNHLGVNMAVEIALKMPLHKNGLIASLEAQNRQNAKSPLEFNDTDWGHFIQGLNNVRQYGFVTWYEWSIANWGTKWNAYHQNDSRNTDDTIYFQTSWSAPLNLIALLSTKFPNVKLTLSYADEDGGSNTGIAKFCNGEDTGSIYHANQSKAAYELYFDLHEGSQENYHLVGDSYEYKDED